MVLHSPKSPCVTFNELAKIDELLNVERLMLLFLEKHQTLMERLMLKNCVHILLRATQLIQ
jgi:hypothetical protein